MWVAPPGAGEVPVLRVVGLADGGVGGLLVDDGLACCVDGDECLDGEVVDGAGVAAGGGVVAEQLADGPGPRGSLRQWS
jgi:hypothetical protein